MCKSNDTPTIEAAGSRPDNQPDNQAGGRPSRTVEYSRTEQVHLLFPGVLNHRGRLYGGALLSWLDEVAGIVAMRHCGGDAVTACVDRMDFKAGAGLGDTICISGRITYVGSSSMEVRIDTYLEGKNDGMRRIINTAYFVMVGVDENGRPVQVPSLQVQTLGEQADWEAGQKRQKLRKMRSQEGF